MRSQTYPDIPLLQVVEKKVCGICTPHLRRPADMASNSKARHFRKQIVNAKLLPCPALGSNGFAYL